MYGNGLTANDVRLSLEMVESHACCTLGWWPASQ